MNQGQQFECTLVHFKIYLSLFGNESLDFAGYKKASKVLLFSDNVILHLKLHFRALQCGGLPSSLSGSAPATRSYLFQG